MTQELFRQEVLDAKATAWLGTIRLATPVSHRMWALASLGIGASIVIWLLAGHYTRREHVAGSLVPQAGLLTVTARSAGTITQLQVTEGQAVHAGDPLLTVSGERSSAALGDTSANISAQLRNQQARLKTDLANTQSLADQQARDLRMQQTMLQGQIHQLDAQIVIEQRQVRGLSDLLTKLEPLRKKGFASAFDVQQQQTQELDAEGQVKSLGRQRYEAQQQLMTATDQLEQLPLTTQGKLSDLRGQIAQAEQTLDSNEADRATVLRAPQDGIVSSLLIKAGQAVTVGQSLLSVMPRNSPLQGQLLVPSSAIGFVRVGTRVVLHYQAFPYQKFGVHHGTVESVSRSALTPSEVTAMLGDKPPEEALYRVQVQLDAQDIEAYGKREALKPGMALDADLLLDKRRLIEWIFEPLYGMGRRAKDEA